MYPSLQPVSQFCSAEVRFIVTAGFTHADQNPNRTEDKTRVSIPECPPVLFRNGDITALYCGEMIASNQ